MMDKNIELLGNPVYNISTLGRSMTKGILCSVTTISVSHIPYSSKSYSQEYIFTVSYSIQIKTYASAVLVSYSRIEEATVFLATPVYQIR